MKRAYQQDSSSSSQSCSQSKRNCNISIGIPNDHFRSLSFSFKKSTARKQTARMQLTTFPSSSPSSSSTTPSNTPEKDDGGFLQGNTKNEAAKEEGKEEGENEKTQNRPREEWIRVRDQELDLASLSTLFIVDYRSAYVYAEEVSLEQRERDRHLPFVNLLPNGTGEVRRYELERALRNAQIREGKKPLLLLNTNFGDVRLSPAEKQKQVQAVGRHYEQVLAAHSTWPAAYAAACAEYVAAGWSPPPPKDEFQLHRIVEVMAVLKLVLPLATGRHALQQPEFKVVLRWSDLTVLLVDVFGSGDGGSRDTVYLSAAAREEQATREAAILDFFLQNHLGASGGEPRSRRCYSLLKVYLNRLVQVALANEVMGKGGSGNKKDAWQLVPRLDAARRYQVFVAPGVEHIDLLYYSDALRRRLKRQMLWYSCTNCRSAFFAADLQLLRHLIRHPRHHCVMTDPPKREEEEEEKKGEQKETTNDVKDEKKGDDGGGVDELVAEQGGDEQVVKNGEKKKEEEEEEEEEKEVSEKEENNEEADSGFGQFENSEGDSESDSESIAERVDGIIREMDDQSPDDADADADDDDLDGVVKEEITAFSAKGIKEESKEEEHLGCLENMDAYRNSSHCNLLSNYLQQFSALNSSSSSSSNNNLGNGSYSNGGGSSCSSEGQHFKVKLKNAYRNSVSAWGSARWELETFIPQLEQNEQQEFSSTVDCSMENNEDSESCGGSHEVQPAIPMCVVGHEETEAANALMMLSRGGLF